VNLSERLAAAKRTREGFDAPAPHVPDVESADLIHSPAWGKPGPCPRCTTMGEVDFIDLVRAITSQHCPSCGFEWVLSRADFDALTS
jgi:hypothetical protein